ncbi:hypothetical protein L9F63_001418, partial [Diploptera punctata]
STIRFPAVIKKSYAIVWNISCNLVMEKLEKLLKDRIFLVLLYTTLSEILEPTPLEILFPPFVNLFIIHQMKNETIVYSFECLKQFVSLR